MTQDAGRGLLRVLLVDDNLAIRTAVGRLLSRLPGLELVGAAESGEEAIVFALARDPDVVIMDVTMPGIGGLEATRRLKALLPRCRAIGHDGRGAVQAAGADDFVQKGDTTERLMEGIRGS